MKKKEIKFVIELDENNLPHKIEWEASDADFAGRRECSSMMIRLWDKEENNTMNIDLWTSGMLVQHMTIHYFHTLLSMAETFQRATGNLVLSEAIRQFAYQFAQQAGIKQGGE